MFPDFLCIGAQRSGTTWLYQNLRRHPEIWMPPAKEIHYFDEREMIRSLSPSQVHVYKFSFYKRNLRLAYQSLKGKKRTEIFDTRLQIVRWYFKYVLRVRSSTPIRKG